ncbi:MAG: hypothetical protein RI580_16865, partial [Halothece sp. Uz-M2-17]|nr:hypothetical protein [Halothece sp. Uz-M2-17]
PNQFIFNTDNPSAIINAGDLEVSAAHTLSLFGGSIANTGNLTASEGNIIVTAVPGKNVLRISQPGNVLTLEITPPQTEAGEWNLSVYDLPELLTGEKVEGLAVDETTETVTLNGTEIPTTTGSNLITGELDVSGETGGNIYVLGDKVGLYEGQLSAEGLSGGGNIFVGGDDQGEGNLPTAQRTYISAGSVLEANAITQGDGGKVMVWANEATAFSGEINARGGAEAGNGGFVEVSGKELLSFKGRVDVSALQGNLGTVLLDPRDILIESSETLEDQIDDDQVTDGEILRGDGETAVDFTISDLALTSITGNILLEASRDIIALETTNLVFSNQVLGNTITFNADRNLEIKSNISTNGGTVNLTANTGLINVQNIDTSLDNEQAGAINLTASGDITTGRLDTGIINGDSSGAIAVNSTNGNITTNGIVNTSSDESGNGGDLSLTAFGEISLNSLATKASIGTGGAVNLDAGGDVSIGQLALGSISGEAQEMTIDTPGVVSFLAQPEIQGADLSIGQETPVANFVSDNNLNTAGGDFSLALSDNYSLPVALNTGGGNFNLTSSGDLTISSVIDTNGGNITVTGNNITDTEDVFTPLDSSNFNGDGGDITLNAENTIDVGNLRASGNFGSLEGEPSNGGNIILSANGDIEVGTLNTEGGITGGEIEVTTEGFFRAVGEFGEAGVSLSSFGDEAGGNIIITHGGAGETPFVVGEETSNGTVGTITSGEFEIVEGSFPFTTEEGNIAIISIQEFEPETPVEIPEPELPPKEEPELPVEKPNPERLHQKPVESVTIGDVSSSLQLVTLDQAQEILRQLEEATGVKPGLVYVNFTPKTLRNATDFQRQEAISTQAYEEYFNLPQRKADLTLSLPQQASDQLDLLLITEEGNPYQIVVEEATRAKVEARATQLYEMISVPPSPFANRSQPYLQPGQELYDWLIEPLSET